MALAAVFVMLQTALSLAAEPTPTPSPSVALAVAYPNPALVGETVTLEGRTSLLFHVDYGWQQIRLGDEPAIGFPVNSARIITFTAPIVDATTTFRFEVTLRVFPGGVLGKAAVDVTVLPVVSPGLEIAGRVAESEPCEGARNGQVVQLSPLGWAVITHDIDGEPGRFLFTGVPPGSYEVALFGDGIVRCATCYPPVDVDASANLEVDLCPRQATPSATQTPSSPTATATDTPPPPTATNTETAPFACPGDCRGDNIVDGSELIGMIRAVLVGPDAECPSYDRNGDDTITVDEAVAAVAASLGPCHQ